MKILISTLIIVFVLTLMSCNIHLNATVTSQITGTSIQSGRPDVANGWGKNNAGNVKTRTCWGASCGRTYSGSKNQTVYTSYSLYYGHTYGGANQQAWAY